MSLNQKVESTPYISLSDYQQPQQITLRTLNYSDIDDFMQWAKDDEVTKYLMWNSYSSRSEAEGYFVNVVEKHSWYKAICLDESVIGSITLDKGQGAHNCKAELGYVIAKQYWGHGYATKAVRLAIKTGFKDLEIERIEAFVDPINLGSQRVLEKNEFIKEGLLRSYVIQKGILKDRFIYAFFRPTY